MNWFNFGNKNNDSLSKETEKAYWEFRKQHELNLPTTEEAIKYFLSLSMFTISTSH